MKCATAAMILTLALTCPARADSAIGAVWANDGGDKVTQDELRASGGTPVINSLWDGTTVSLFGAMNEVVSFNLILEAPTNPATNVTVGMSNLTGPSGSVIRYSPRASSDLFDWTTTEIELFYVGYLQILGLSNFGGTLATFQEPTFPQRAQCPAPQSVGCAWTDRPAANKLYPDIAVPIELVPSFNIAAGGNQSIWADIYIPKTAAAGIYTGTVTISENGVPTHTVSISLRVRNFSLPDSPVSKTMLYSDSGDLGARYGDADAFTAMQNEMLLAHRHKVSLIDGGNMGAGWDIDAPAAQWIPFLDGSAFTAGNGYAGPGVATGNGVFSIGTYGSMTSGTTQSAFTTNFDNWEAWFEANSPSTERFVYLCDETVCQTGTPDLPTQLGWWSAIAGAGQNLHTMATQLLLDAQPTVLSDPTSTWPFSQGPSSRMGGYTTSDQAAVNSVLAQEPARRLFAYNGGRPGSGSFATEDAGVALRELPWGQYKKSIDRWFFWEATYYNNYQGGLGNTNVFTTAQTFGGAPHQDPSYGLINYSNNGDGVLFYPGTDLIYPSNSYGIGGPIASLRLKQWRRGIQDVDYLALANQINPAAVQSLVDQMVPAALWENQCADPVNDCSYFIGPISWSETADDWEAARAKLADIVDPPAPVDSHDFNGDGVSDILWKDAAGDAAMWLMAGGQFASGASLGNVGAAWSVVGTRDFTGAGDADILWSDTGGDFAIWLMSGISFRSGVGLGNVGTQWQVAGTGDFNGDRTGDILWRNSATGDVAIWLMSNGALSSGLDLGAIPLNWTVVGTGDFNGDGTADILWRNQSTGDLAIWLLQNGQFSSGADLGGVPLTWTVVGTGDFNGDGTSDILWRDASGNLAIWLMSNGAFSSGATIAQVPTTWSVAETGDFNGDGMSDILWTDTSGDVAIWLMNGTSLSSGISLGNVGTSWQVQGQNAD